MAFAAQPHLSAHIYQGRYGGRDNIKAAAVPL
jgi:hypothetical protein